MTTWQLIDKWPLSDWPLATLPDIWMLTTDCLTDYHLTLGTINQEVRCQRSHGQVIFDGQCMVSNVKWMKWYLMVSAWCQMSSGWSGEFSWPNCHFGMHFMTLHSWSLITLTTLTMTLKTTSLTALTPCPLVHKWCKVVNVVSGQLTSAVSQLANSQCVIVVSQVAKGQSQWPTFRVTCQVFSVWSSQWSEWQDEW
jgi:hypothetical protein